MTKLFPISRKEFELVFIKLVKISICFSSFFGLVAALSFDPNINEGLEIHHWISFIAANLCIVTLILPLCTPMFLLIQKIKNEVKGGGTHER